MSGSPDQEVPLVNLGGPWYRSRVTIANDEEDIKAQFPFSSTLINSTILHVEKITQTIVNFNRLFACLDTSHAPLLQNIYIGIAPEHTYRSHGNRDVYSESAVNERAAPWQAWFVQNIRPDAAAILPTRNLTVCDYGCSDLFRETSVYRVILPLLARVPWLQSLELLIDLPGLPPDETDLDATLPYFPELRKLTVRDINLSVLRALMGKIGPRFETLNISGWLCPDINRNYDAPLSAKELLDMMRDPSSLALFSPLGEPVRIKHLRALAGLEIPRQKIDAMHTSQAASFIGGIPLLSRLHTLMLDQPTFSALCSFAHLYLSDNPLPSTVRFLGLYLVDWANDDVDDDVFGSDSRRVDKAFEVLRLQIERGEARMLREVEIALGVECEEAQWLDEELGLWADFRATCRRKRIEVRSGSPDELW